MKVKILPFEYCTEENLTFKKDLKAVIPKGSTIQILLIQLSGELGYFFRKFVFNPDTLSIVQNTIVLVNGKVIQSLDGWNTELFDGDNVIIGRMYTGG